MRYMGDLSAEMFGSAALDPTVKAVLIAQAASVPELRARDLVEITDATQYGAKVRYFRFAAGAAAGLALGLVLGRRKRKR